MPSSLFESPSIHSPGQVVLPPQGFTPKYDHMLEDFAPRIEQQPQDDVPVHSHAGWKIARLLIIYTILFLIPVASALGINYAIAADNNRSVASAEQPISPVVVPNQSGAPVANTVSADTSTNGNDFEYELSLANGFLNKAVNVSNESPTQTVDERNQVIALLNQALDAANRAVTLSPNDARGYSARGRVYQATSTVKPEMKALADQDFAKAKALGATDPTQAPPTQDPMQLLPTQQANTGKQAMIAAPQPSADTGTVSSDQQANANRGTATIDAGKTEVFVSYPSVKADTQLYVNAEKNPENLTFYVKNKQEGVGFTIAATAAPSAPVELTWWEIQ